MNILSENIDLKSKLTPFLQVACHLLILNSKNENDGN